MGKYIIAIDQGTTSSRCIIFGKNANVCSKAQKEFSQIYRQPGWVEHDPVEIWSSVLSVVTEAMARISISAEDIETIGITNQRETTVMWNKHTGEPVYNAICWQCRRTSDMIDKIKARGYDKMINEKTGLVADAYFSASKIAWILEHVDGARALAESGDLLFGTIDTWLIWKLTKGMVHATDYTNASRTMIYNIYDRCYDEELLRLFDIPKNILPAVYPSSHIFGETDEKLFGGRIKISGVAGDQQAALFGQCCFEPGEAKNTYGTGCFLLMNTGHTPVKSQNGLVTTMAASVDDEPVYALEGSVFVAGASIKWLRDSLRMVREASQTEEYAMRVEDTLGMYIVPAFTGLGAPYWEQDSRGIVVGITRGCNKEHFIRATLESIAYQAYDVIKAMEEDFGGKIHELCVDGGASANNFLMEFQAGILNAKVVRPKCIETTALGVAFLAGLATGFYRDIDELKNIPYIEKTFVPQMSEEDRIDKLKGWKRAVRCAIAYAKE